MIRLAMHKIHKILFICTAVLAAFITFGHSPISAQEISEIKADGNKFPTNITANHMRYEANRKQVVFEGSVKVRRPDFDLDSIKLTILFKEKKEKPQATDDPLSTMGGGDIDKLIAEGQVLMVREGREGKCGKVTYYVDKELIVMEQNPVLSEGKNTVSGQKINFYVRDNKSEVIGSDTSPVKVHLSSPKSVQGE